MKKYLLFTGATGFIGRYLLRQMLSDDVPVAVIARASGDQGANERIQKIVAGFEKELGRSLSDEENESPTERLWALHHCGARSEAFAILRSRFQPLKSPADRLLFSVMALRLGETDALLDWVKEDSAVLQGHEEDRRVYPLLAANLLIREAAESGIAGFPTEALQNLLAGLPKSYMTGWHLFNRARDSQPDLALAIGNTLAKGNLGGNGDFLYSVAKVAQSLGRNDEYLDWLDRCLVEMDPVNGEGLPVSYFPALTERFATIESAGDRMQFLVDESLRIESHPAATERIRHEHRALVALASGNAESAIDSIRSLARGHRPYTRTFGRTFNFESEIFSETDHWIRMEEILREFGSRQIPGMDPFEFYEAIGGSETPPPVAEDLETREQFEQFEIVRLVWLMERLSPPERARRLQEGFSQLTDPNSKLELASLLEARGFHRESIPIYRELIRDDPGDISPLRGFFGACRKSFDFEPALALIQQYLDGELPTPTGLTADYLSQNHAEFLYMGRDLENLAARAQDPVADPGGLARNPLLGGESQNPWRYHDALVRVHEKRDQPEALLRVLDHLRTRGHATEEDRLLAARVLREQGESDVAIDWLNEIQFDQKQIEVEVEAIRELAGLYTESETPPRAKLADLARSALEYNNSSLVSELAIQLNEIGAQTEAQSCLLLQARKKGNGSGDRTRMLIDLIRLELENGAAFDQIEDDTRVLLEGLPPNDGEGTRHFLQLVVDFGSRDREAWLDFLGPYEIRPATRIPAIIGAATLRGKLDQAGAQLAEATGDDSDEFGRALESLAFLNEAGTDAARDLLERRQATEATLLDGDPMRQIAVFGALKDRTRAAELLSRLLEETASDLFHRFNLANLPGTFVNRWRVPQAFSDAGFPDMAGALYREYHRRVPRLTHEHADFVESYTRYLIDREEFLQAENVLAPAIQKSIGLDPEVLVDLYAASDRLDEIDHLIQKLYLSSGIRVQVEELAAERRM